MQLRRINSLRLICCERHFFDRIINKFWANYDIARFVISFAVEKKWHLINWGNFDCVVGLLSLKWPNDTQKSADFQRPYQTYTKPILKAKKRKKNCLWQRWNEYQKPNGKSKKRRNVNIMIQIHDAICVCMVFDVVFVALFPVLCSTQFHAEHRQTQKMRWKHRERKRYTHTHRFRYRCINICIMPNDECLVWAWARIRTKSCALFISDSSGDFFFSHSTIQQKMTFLWLVMLLLLLLSLRLSKSTNHFSVHHHNCLPADPIRYSSFSLLCAIFTLAPLNIIWFPLHFRISLSHIWLTTLHSKFTRFEKENNERNCLNL